MKFSLVISALLVFINIDVLGQRTLAEASLDFENVSELSVRGSMCNVEVKKGSVNHIEAFVSGKGDPDDYEFVSVIQGGEMRFELDRPNNSWNDINEAWIVITIVDIDQLSISNSSGNIDASDIAGEELRLSSTSGNVDASDLSAQRISLKATSGNIRLDNADGQTEAVSTSGNVRLREVKGNCYAKSTSGNVELKYFEGSTELQSTSGNISVSNGKGLSYVKTTSGDISGYALMLDDDLTLRSTSGDIELEVMNASDDLSFDLSSNSGDLEALNYDGEDDLYIKNGPIWIKGNTTSGNIEIDN